MKLHLKVSVMKCVTASLFVSLAVVSCRTELLAPALVDLPTQRVKAQTTSSLGVYADQISINTALIGGTIYQISAKDSLNLRYDAQQRLVSHTLTQVSQTYGQRHTTATRSEYTYGVGSMIEREGITQEQVGRSFRYLLDDSQRRVLSRNKLQYAYLQIDTLRAYSTEGILIDNSAGSQNTGFMPSTNRRKVILETGNAVGVEEYATGSGKLVSRTHLMYDMKHFAPLAVFTLLGENSRNAVLKKTETVYKSDGTTIDYTHELTYRNEYNSQGQMTRQTEYIQGGVYSQKKALSLTEYYY